jgi:hypothetical protein
MVNLNNGQRCPDLLFKIGKGNPSIYSTGSTREKAWVY